MSQNESSELFVVAAHLFGSASSAVQSVAVSSVRAAMVPPMLGAMTTQPVQEQEYIDWSTVDFDQFPQRMISLDEEPEE